MAEGQAGRPAAWRPPWRARLRGRWLRMRKWEYWPAWVVYLPLLWRLPWATRHIGTVRLATRVNPGIALGGLAGESKSGILELLGSGECVARWIAVDPGGHAGRVDQVRSFAESLPAPWPLVIKPDRGERGAGVRIVHDEDQLSEAVASIPIRFLAQEFVDGEEYGIFWSDGRIVSLAHKAHVFVQGDGVRSLGGLLCAEDRVLPLLDLHLRRHADRLSSVPAAGETVGVTELGTHALGATFLDRRDLCTPDLEQTISAIMERAEGLDFGRFDVRVPDTESLRRGQSLKILEFNGLTSEPAHMYDPDYPLRRARLDLLRQWKAAVELGHRNTPDGEPVPGWGEILRAVQAHARETSTRGG